MAHNKELQPTVNDLEQIPRHLAELWNMGFIKAERQSKENVFLTTEIGFENIIKVVSAVYLFKWVPFIGKCEIGSSEDCLTLSSLLYPRQTLKVPAIDKQKVKKDYQEIYEKGLVSLDFNRLTEIGKSILREEDRIFSTMKITTDYCQFLAGKTKKQDLGEALQRLFRRLGLQSKQLGWILVTNNYRYHGNLFIQLGEELEKTFESGD